VKTRIAAYGIPRPAGEIQVDAAARCRSGALRAGRDGGVGVIPWGGRRGKCPQAASASEQQQSHRAAHKPRAWLHTTSEHAAQQRASSHAHNTPSAARAAHKRLGSAARRSNTNVAAYV